MTATVVIPTFNRARRLADLLRCLSRQDRGVARVVVCDDGSEDDTERVSRSFESVIPLVYCRQENKGFRAGQCRNLGIERATGEVIIFLDDDLLVAPDFVASHLRAHCHPQGKRKGDRSPRVAIGLRHRSHGREHPGGHPGDFEGPTLEQIVRAECDDRVEVLGGDALGIALHETPWFFVYSCNFSVTRSADTPRFDEGFVGWGMEDIEYGYRLYHSGHEVLSAPRARALHIEDPKPRDPFRCEVRALPPTYDSYVRNSVYFMDLHPTDTVLARMIRQDMRWFVRDESRDAWVKNGYANDVDAVIAHCRREREIRCRQGQNQGQNSKHAPYDAHPSGE